jgi:hypothetical protein
MSILLLGVFKWTLILSTVVFGVTYFYKDTMPEPDYYQDSNLTEPLQTRTFREEFSVEVNDQTYNIIPKYDYELHGVVVSYHDADVMHDIYHHEKWKDFINLRDLCVIWGNNVSSGVYKNMEFDSNTWTCWAYWPDHATGKLFSMRELSNNHVLSNKEHVNRALLSAEPGDYIRFKGVLAEYSNPGSGFTRGTSTRRDDKGNGACETIYIDEFEIINKANAGIRSLHSMMQWVAGISLVGFIVMFLIAPVRK